MENDDDKDNKDTVLEIIPSNQLRLHLFLFQTPININEFLNNSLCFCKYL